MRTATTLLAVAAVFVAGCGSTTTETTTSPTTSTTVVATAPFDLPEVVEEFVGTTPGGAVALVFRDGEQTFVAFGDADADGTALTRETPFRVGSISKPFVATMVLQMVDEGSVELDEMLGNYLPNVVVGRDVTIRQLLSHQSGLANYTDRPAFFLTTLDDFTRSFSSDEILSFVAYADPGPTGVFEYSNTNYILLGMLIEHIDGVSLNDSLQARIAGPWGLADTSFVGRGVEPPADLSSFWSVGFNTGEVGMDYESVASAAWAAGSLVSTVDDLATFMRLLFEGELLPAGTLAEMTDTGASGYGLGLFAAQLGVGNPGFAHNGSIPGYSSSMAFAPASGDLLIVLTNNDFLIADRLAEQIVAGW